MVNEEGLTVRERAALAIALDPPQTPTCALPDCARKASLTTGRWAICAEHAKKIRRARCYDG